MIGYIGDRVLEWRSNVNLIGFNWEPFQKSWWLLVQSGNPFWNDRVTSFLECWLVQTRNRFQCLKEKLKTSGLKWSKSGLFWATVNLYLSHPHNPLTRLLYPSYLLSMLFYISYLHILTFLYYLTNRIAIWLLTNGNLSSLPHHHHNSPHPNHTATFTSTQKWSFIIPNHPPPQRYPPTIPPHYSTPTHSSAHSTASHKAITTSHTTTTDTTSNTTTTSNSATTTTDTTQHSGTSYLTSQAKTQSPASYHHPRKTCQQSHLTFKPHNQLKTMGAIVTNPPNIMGQCTQTCTTTLIQTLLQHHQQLISQIEEDITSLSTTLNHVQPLDISTLISLASKPHQTRKRKSQPPNPQRPSKRQKTHPPTSTKRQDFRKRTQSSIPPTNYPTITPSKTSRQPPRQPSITPPLRIPPKSQPPNITPPPSLQSPPLNTWLDHLVRNKSQFPHRIQHPHERKAIKSFLHKSSSRRDCSKNTTDNTTEKTLQTTEQRPF